MGDGIRPELVRELSLEALGGAQKHLLRMGPVNARRVQASLRRMALALGVPAERLDAFKQIAELGGLPNMAPLLPLLLSLDGKPYTVQRFVLGSAPAKLPIPEPRCPELQELIQQMEQLPAPDGFRRITHLLVDAGARDFTWVDPLPKDIIATPPAISFTVATAKFQGRVTVLYERGLDVYAVELHRDGELVDRVDEVFFDSLGGTLERLIDDGNWRRIRVQCLSGRKPVRH